MSGRTVLLAAFALVAVAAIAQSPQHPRGAPPVAAAPVRTGQALYDYHCAGCHGDGPGHPGTAALAFKYQGQEPALLTKRTDLDADTVKLVVRSGISAMPYFRKTEIGDADLDRLARYVAEAGKAPAQPAKQQATPAPR